MKLATINPRLDFSMDDIIAKEAYMASLPAAQYEAACFHYNTMQQGTSNPGANISLDQSQFLPQKPGSSSLQIPEMLLDPTFISVIFLNSYSFCYSILPPLFQTPDKRQLLSLAAITTAIGFRIRLAKPIQCWISLA